MLDRRHLSEWSVRKIVSPFFPGGMASDLFQKDGFLDFEKVPFVNIELQWATYYDASDEAGLSLLYGGIHISSDDLVGRQTQLSDWD